MFIAHKFLKSQQGFKRKLGNWRHNTLQDKNNITVNNPYHYAWEPYRNFVRAYLNKPIQVLFLGINPSPAGMGRNRIPFGDIDTVLDWLKITGKVTDLEKNEEISIENLRRNGGENSGKKLWGLMKDLTDTAENFFDHCFVHNYCPLLFTKDGKNLTPNEVPNRDELEHDCDKNLLATLDLLQISCIVGIGEYAAKRAKKVRNQLMNRNIKAMRNNQQQRLANDPSPSANAIMSTQVQIPLFRQPQQAELQQRQSTWLPVIQITHPATRNPEKLTEEEWKKQALDELNKDPDFPKDYFKNWKSTCDKYKV